jgi:hypothetical protein
MTDRAKIGFMLALCVAVVLLLLFLAREPWRWFP